MSSMEISQLNSNELLLVNNHISLYDPKLFSQKDERDLCSLFNQKCSTQHDAVQKHYNNNILLTSDNFNLYSSDLEQNISIIDNSSWQGSEDSTNNDITHKTSGRIDYNPYYEENERINNDIALPPLETANFLSRQIDTFTPTNKAENNFGNPLSLIKPLKAVYYPNFNLAHQTSNYSTNEKSSTNMIIHPTSKSNNNNNTPSPYLYLFFRVGKIPQILSTYSIYEIY
ncbi:unnamed protein product [Gordionus sp. m RMFG-2023]|uniref:uncharacterized protein LOC135931569 n=1 Tax=Gordionus sp. m RMFG-2023 TaxID=3053472 RepID=UPI0030DEFC0B